MKYRHKNLHNKILLIASIICLILILVCSCTKDAISPEPRGWYRVASGTEFILYDVEFIDSKKGFIVGNWGIILYTMDGGESWTIQNPYDFTVHLNGVHFPTADTGYAVGQSCAVKRTIDGGATWNFFSLNVPDNSFNGVWFVSPALGIAVGYDDKIFRTTDGGVSWSEQHSGETSLLHDVCFVHDSTGNSLYAISFTNTSTVQPLVKAAPSSGRPTVERHGQRKHVERSIH